MKQQVGVVAEELHIALEHRSSLESQIANSQQRVKDLEQKMFSDVQLLQKYKQERDELQIERNNAIKEAEELRKERAELLRKKQAEVAVANTLQPQFFSEFSYSEIVEATSNFDQSLQIGEGGNGNVYRGLLRHTLVAIKKLHSNSMQGPSEFEQEVFTGIVPAVGGQAGLSEGTTVQDGWYIQHFEDRIVKLIRDDKIVILDPSKLFAHYGDRPEALSLLGKVLKFWPVTFAEVLNKGDYFVRTAVDTVYFLMQQAELCCANPLNETAFAEIKNTVEGLQCLGAKVDWYLPLLQGALACTVAMAELTRMEEMLKEAEVEVVALRAKKTGG